MLNIQFNYLYRDASSYKNYGFVIFQNENIKLENFESLIRGKLIDGEFFIAGDWQLPDLHFKSWDEQTDHNWHEFESIELTDKPSNTLLKLAELITLVENTNWVFK